MMRWFGRCFWISFGIGVHVLFALTVRRLFLFLQAGDGRLGLFAAHPASKGWLWLDALLAAQFAVSHSWLLLPATQRRLQRILPREQYGCCFCLATCISLLATIEFWQPSPVALWLLQGGPRRCMQIAFVLGWVALFYSLYLSGLGWQTGFTPWWAWLRNHKPPRRPFVQHGAYRLLRHPIYLSFLSLVWLTPSMTLDRAVLTAAWTVYIFVGSYLKDRRLAHYLGQTYREYQERVPGYPLIGFGPLGRVPLPAGTVEVITARVVMNEGLDRGLTVPRNVGEPAA